MIVLAIVVLILAIFAVWTGHSCDYDNLFTGGIAVIVVEAVIAVCAFVYWVPAEYTCSRKAEIIGAEYNFDLMGGCFIKEDGRWYEYNQQRIIR